MKTDTPQQSGFALLMTLIVVTVVVSIGLTLLDLSIKQVRLSTNAKDSEIAFHAAYAGMECAKYIRRVNETAMEQGDPISPGCFSGTLTANTVSDVPQGQITGDGEAYLYTFAITWPDEMHCSEVTALVASSTTGGGGMTISGMKDGNDPLVPGYPDSDEKSCAEGERCTVLSVRGFNKLCDDIDGYGVVQREVLLQF